MQAEKKDAKSDVLTEDLSNGAEPTKLRVINDVNEETIAPFEYILGVESAPGLDNGECPKTGHGDQQNGATIVRALSFFQVFYANPVKKWSLQTLAAIKKGTALFEYTGVLSKSGDHHHTDIDQDDYIIGFTHHGQDYLLDAYRKGNLARFINHSCRPNCRAMLATNDNNNTTNDAQCVPPRVLIYAMRELNAGDEILIDYGAKWWSAKAGTIKCVCKSSMCKKYGEEANITDMLKGCSIASKTVEADDEAGKSQDEKAIAIKGGKIVGAAKSVDGQPPIKEVNGRVIAIKNVKERIAMKTVDGGRVVAVKSAQGRVALATKSVVGKALAKKAVQQSTNDGACATKSVDQQAIPIKCVDGRAIAAKVVDGRAIAAKVVDGRAIAVKTVDGRAIAVKAVDG